MHIPRPEGKRSLSERPRMRTRAVAVKRLVQTKRSKRPANERFMVEMCDMWPGTGRGARGARRELREAQTSPCDNTERHPPSSQCAEHKRLERTHPKLNIYIVSRLRGLHGRRWTTIVIGYTRQAQNPSTEGGKVNLHSYSSSGALSL